MDRDPVTVLRAGGLVTMVDEQAAVGGVELWMAAELAEAAVFARLVRYTSGFVSVAMPAVRCAALGFPAMTGIESSYTETRPVQAVTCDAAEGISTGISAADRALTARLLADPDSTPNDFRRPGHLVPLRIRADVTKPTAPARNALTMCTVAGLRQAMVRCEVVLDSGALARPADGFALAQQLGSPVVLLRELAAVTPIATAIAQSA
jgi:3,4-dihydroxy 2-butanone 4-phosphate synthase / GTP cyclohydrolase II